MGEVSSTLVSSPPASFSLGAHPLAEQQQQEAKPVLVWWYPVVFASLELASWLWRPLCPNFERSFSGGLSAWIDFRF
jgi:hypothetical protein